MLSRPLRKLGFCPGQEGPRKHGTQAHFPFYEELFSGRPGISSWCRRLACTHQVQASRLHHEIFFGRSLSEESPKDRCWVACFRGPGGKGSAVQELGAAKAWHTPKPVNNRSFVPTLARAKVRKAHGLGSVGL